MTTLHNFIESYSITGNTIVDTIIIANILPIMIAYVAGVFELFKDNMSSIIEYIGKIFFSKVKNKFIGELMCDVYIQRTSPIFIPLKATICSENMNEFEIKGSITKKILNIANSSNFLERYMKYDNIKDNVYYLHVNNKKYTLDDKYYAEDEKIKIYTKDGLYFVFKYIQECKENNDTKDKDNKNTVVRVTHERIELKIIKFTDNKYDKSEISEIFNKFIQNDLKLDSHIIYVAKLYGTDKNFTSLVDRMFTNIKSEGNKFCMGDNVFDNINEQNYNDNDAFDISFNISNLNETTENIRDLVNIASKKSVSKDFTCNFIKLYNKFVGDATHLSGSLKYFINDNTIYFMCDDPCEIVIVSIGILLSDDILKDKLKYLLDASWKTNTFNKKVKSSINLYSYDSNANNNKGGWCSTCIDPRGVDTIYLPSKTVNLVVNEINNFIRLSKLYKICSIPYKKGMLFYGPPGTGKTSFVKSLAYEYQMNIFSLNLNDEKVNDDSINSILNSMGSLTNKILLFEDVDTAFADKEQIKMEHKLNHEISNKNDEKKMPQIKFLTYSGLLNALDGVMTNHHGVITIMTTNYIEKLGSALIRPGRIDIKILLKECDGEQIKLMCNSIISKYLSILEETRSGLMDTNTIESLKYTDETFKLKKINEFVEKLVNENKESTIAPSKLQVYILKYIDKIDNIFDNYQELLE